MTAPRLVMFALDYLAAPPWLAVLSEAERRHGATLEGRQQRRFLNGRIALRVSAAQLLDCATTQVGIERNTLGQLSISVPEPLFVSLSYGAHMGLLLLASTRIGLDYEDGPAPVFWQSAMRRYLCQCEQRWLQAQDAATQEREQGFVWLWTRREAFLKYLGVGIRGKRQCLCDLSEDEQPCQRRFNLAGGTGTLVSEEPLNGLQTRFLTFDTASPSPFDDLLHWPEMPNIGVHSRPG
ncbi:4'-phosphopantetheinyl transferase family protein [Pseudomonas sp. MWU13-2105]|uniref:4'-phosphopantetheinyl transferase family protein n=1 Tax=Pseudomonas sp. MWU13-2105 TaxID=2935074 RepID=UPI0020107391|nr:4'-phosphopantetheinyl transferase superfamily protein [Pseudomonas sp. MWU13-2105]